MATASRCGQASSSTPSSAACWICLDEGPDDKEGNSLVRECAYRGDSAGFVHSSCLVQYADSKSRDEVKKLLATGEFDIHQFQRYWVNCPNCLQLYGENLLRDMANAFCSRAQKKMFLSPGIDGRIDNSFFMIIALHCKLRFVLEPDPRNVQEGKVVASLLSSLMDNYDKGGSVSFGRYLQTVESDIQFSRGMFVLVSSRESGDNCIGKSMEISESIGDSASALQAKMIQHVCVNNKKTAPNEGAMTAAKAMGAWGRHGCDLQLARKCHEDNLNKCGENHASSINSSMVLCMALMQDHHFIEGERLMRKCVSISRRLLGANYKTTKDAEQVLQKMIKRLVRLQSHDGVFEVLRYDDDCMGSCTVKGLTAQYRGKPTFSVNMGRVTLMPGTPVVCYGLKNAKHLNDEMGDARILDEPTGRYKVHFEAKSLKPALVRPKNVRIVFDIDQKALLKTA
ncbi:hypothetical protein ACHAWF_006636 [Thalassiosira exigua]